MAPSEVGRATRRSLLIEALGRLIAWRQKETTRRFGTNFRLATQTMRQAVLGTKLDREEDSTQLGWRF